jgi:hypothetical protein
VRVFLTDYNMLRYYARLAKPPYRATELLKKAGVPASDRETLATHLPDVFDNYRARFQAIRGRRPADDALKFAIESLCRMTLQLAGLKSKGPAWVSKLARLFALSELELVLRSEKLLSTPGPFNFLIFGEETVAGEDDTAEDDVGAYGAPGADSEDVLNAIEELGGEDGAADPFSLENVDISDVGNLDPQ